MPEKVMDTTSPVRKAVRRAASAAFPWPPKAEREARLEEARQLRRDAEREHAEEAQRTHEAIEALAGLVLTTLSGLERETVACALADAAEGNRDRSAHCGECEASPSGLCEGCAERLDRADSYDALAAALAPVVTQ